MSDPLIINKTLSKPERYKSLLPQIKSLIDGENDLMANLGNICAALKYSMDNFLWVGFYFKQGEELVQGPFQGPVVCTRIKILDRSSHRPNGVCGTAVQEGKTVIVDDVSKFSGHIVYSTDSKSEIVIPVFTGDKVAAVLDADSYVHANFDKTDKQYLEEVCELVSQLIHSAK
jgi:GAF domain-containing protein